MLEYLAFRNMLWAFTKLPVWLFIGAIACLFWRAPETFDRHRVGHFTMECIKAKYPHLTKDDIWTKEQVDSCAPYAIKKAEAEYAQAQSKK
jgi:hypothetical protein